MESKTRIKWFDSLDSTNDELLRHLPTYDNLSVVAAVEQFAGRGQRGNRWLSEPGDNLTFSLLLRPDRLPARARPVSIIYPSSGVYKCRRGTRYRVSSDRSAI